MKSLARKGRNWDSLLERVRLDPLISEIEDDVNITRLSPAARVTESYKRQHLLNI